MPLVVLADLVARRVTPDVATAAVIALTERGAPDGELAALRAHVERLIGRGNRPTSRPARAPPSSSTPCPPRSRATGPGRSVPERVRSAAVRGTLAE
jgi:hypothetical protein